MRATLNIGLVFLKQNIIKHLPEKLRKNKLLIQKCSHDIPDHKVFTKHAQDPKVKSENFE